MKKISILKYDLKRVPVTKKTLIHRALYGYIDHSNKGNYTYTRKGALSTLKYTKIGNSVLMINTKDVESIIPLFKKYKIKVHIMGLIMP
ncbi:MAG: hypothetical protein NTX24_00740 [Candidatus Pacearchaeota archaeon]|nr:hypothetical protein [Candidatus Pacearchaeota archaeon]